MKSKIKLLGMDFDATLVDFKAPSSWELLDRELRCEEEDAKLNKEYFDEKWILRHGLEKLPIFTRNMVLLLVGFKKSFEKI